MHRDFDKGDEFRGDAAAGLAGNVAGSDLGQERSCLSGGEVLLRSAWDEFEQQLVELGGHPGVVLAEGSSPVDQDPQDGELLVVDDRPQSRHPGSDQGHGVGVGFVSLAALPGGEHSRPGRQLRRDIDHGFVVGNQPHRDMLADALAASIAQVRSGHCLA